MTRGSLRRSELELTREETLAILAQGDIGFLGTVGADQMPYTIPVNYAMDDEYLYFHSAETGHKLDNIKANPQVCFTVVGEYQVLAAKLSAYYRSAVVFGTAAIVEDNAVKRHALQLLMQKYSAGYQCSTLQKEHIGPETAVVAIKMELVTGKRSHDVPD